MLNLFSWLMKPTNKVALSVAKVAVETANVVLPESVKIDPPRNVFLDLIEHPEDHPDKEQVVEAAVAYIRSPDFRMINIDLNQYNYVSNGGEVTVCRDIYGPEVKLFGGELLDCRPAFYNLTKEHAMMVYDAICDRVYKRTVKDQIRDKAELQKKGTM